MRRDSLQEIAEVSAGTIAYMIPSSDVDRLGGYVLRLNGSSTDTLEEQMMDMAAYSSAVAAALSQGKPETARYIVGVFMRRVDE